MGDSISSRTRFTARLRLRDTVTNADSLRLDEGSASLLSPLAQQGLQIAGPTGAAQNPLAPQELCCRRMHLRLRFMWTSVSCVLMAGSDEGAWPFPALPSPVHGTAKNAGEACQGPGTRAAAVLSPLHDNGAAAARPLAPGLHGAVKGRVLGHLQLPSDPPVLGLCTLYAWP